MPSPILVPGGAGKLDGLERRRRVDVTRVVDMAPFSQHGGQDCLISMRGRSTGRTGGGRHRIVVRQVCAGGGVTQQIRIVRLDGSMDLLKRGRGSVTMCGCITITRIRRAASLTRAEFLSPGSTIIASKLRERMRVEMGSGIISTSVGARTPGRATAGLGCRKGSDRGQGGINGDVTICSI